VAGLWRKGPSWYLRPGGRGTKPIRIGEVATMTRAEAERARVEWDRRNTLGMNAVPGMFTFGEILKRWLAEKRDRRSAKTLAGYDSHANHLTEHFPCSRPIGDIQADQISAYLRARVADAINAGRTEYGAKRTADKVLGTISMIFEWASARGLAERNPCRAVERYGLEPEEKAPAPVALVAELQTVLRAEADAPTTTGEQAHMRRLVADLVEVLWWTGLRVGEACRLTVSDLTLDPAAASGEVVIRSARVKGGKVKRYPIAAEVVPILRAWSDGKPASASVFGIGPMGHDTAARAVAVFRTRWLKGRLPGFPEKRERFRPAFFHSIRHAYASDLERADVDPLVRAALTRHRTTRMLDHYSHRGLDVLREAQAALARSRRKSRRRGSEGP